MITHTIGISHCGLIYNGKLIKTEKQSNGLYRCVYQWLYGKHIVYLTM